MSREVMQQALDALLKLGSEDYSSAYKVGDQWLANIDGIETDVSEFDFVLEAIAALRAELAKPEPVPVAWMPETGPLYRKDEQ